VEAPGVEGPDGAVTRVGIRAEPRVPKDLIVEAATTAEAEAEVEVVTRRAVSQDLYKVVVTRLAPAVLPERTLRMD